MTPQPPVSVDPVRQPTQSRKRRLGFALLSSLGGVIVALLIAEVGLRVLAPQVTGAPALAVDPDVGAIPRPSMEGRKSIPGIYRFSFSHDARGLRVTPTSSPDAEAPLVLLLGDSFAYGMGVENDETFGAHIASLLRDRGTDVRLDNAARVGAAPDFALRLLQARDWTPEVVVYAFCYNDFWNLQAEPYFHLGARGELTPIAPEMGSREELKLKLAESRVYSFVQAHSHVAGLASLLLARGAADDHVSPREMDMDTLSTPVQYAREPAVERARVYMRELKREVESRGGRLVSLYIPSASQVAAYRRSGGISMDERVFLGLLGDLEIDGVTATPALAETPGPLASMYYPETHWRPLGHRVGAQQIIDPVQAALCVQNPDLQGCATAPPGVRQIVEMRVGAGSGG